MFILKLPIPLLYSLVRQHIAPSDTTLKDQNLHH